MKRTAEKLSGNRLRFPAAALGYAAMGAALAAGLQSIEGPGVPSAVHAFEQSYTDAGMCLHDTPYDPALGANIGRRVIRYSEQGNEVLVTDTPFAAALGGPAVLSLLVNPYSPSGFTQGDYATGIVLSGSSCPELPPN